MRRKLKEPQGRDLDHGELTCARDNATHEKSDIASTTLWQEIFTRTCVIRLLYNLWKKRRSTRSLCRTCNLGQNKMEQQPSHPHPSEIKDEAPLWLVGRGIFHLFCPKLWLRVCQAMLLRLHIIKPNCVTQSCVNCRLQSIFPYFVYRYYLPVVNK